MLHIRSNDPMEAAYKISARDIKPPPNILKCKSI
jgi:hypothetical protein